VEGFIKIAAIQLAKMSGFSPIITTASMHNSDYLKSLGATHVVDRKSDVATEIEKISNGPFEVIFIAMAQKETQEMAWEILAPGGAMVVLGPLAVNEKKYPDKRAVFTFGSLKIEANKAMGISLYSRLTELLANGVLKVRFRYIFCVRVLMRTLGSLIRLKWFQMDYAEFQKRWVG